MIETLNLASNSCTGWCWNRNLHFGLLNGLQRVFVFVLCECKSTGAGAFLCGVSSSFLCLCTHSSTLIFLCCHDGQWYCKVYEVTAKMFSQFSLMALKRFYFYDHSNHVSQQIYYIQHVLCVWPLHIYFMFIKLDFMYTALIHNNSAQGW